MCPSRPTPDGGPRMKGSAIAAEVPPGSGRDDGVAPVMARSLCARGRPTAGISSLASGDPRARLEIPAVGRPRAQRLRAMTGATPSSRPLPGGTSAAMADPFILGPPSGVGREGHMEGRVQGLEEKVTRLTERVDQLEQRLSGMALPPLPRSWPLPERQVGTPQERTEVS